jgi:hypothetical protein
MGNVDLGAQITAVFTSWVAMSKLVTSAFWASFSSYVKEVQIPTIWNYCEDEMR